jgi:hypothetical protein
MNDDMVMVLVVVVVLAEGEEVIYNHYFSLIMYPMIKIVGLMMIVMI